MFYFRFVRDKKKSQKWISGTISHPNEAKSRFSPSHISKPRSGSATKLYHLIVLETTTDWCSFRCVALFVFEIWLVKVSKIEFSGYLQKSSKSSNFAHVVRPFAFELATCYFGVWQPTRVQSNCKITAVCALLRSRYDLLKIWINHENSWKIISSIFFNFHQCTYTLWFCVRKLSLGR